jgi:hypothetical protein
MAVYAKLRNDLVINIIEADETFVSSQPDADTYKLLSRGGIGWTYNPEVDVFIEPQPYPSWTLDSNYDWQPPTPMPVVEGKEYAWFEPNQVWIELA